MNKDCLKFKIKLKPIKGERCAICVYYVVIPASYRRGLAKLYVDMLKEERSKLRPLGKEIIPNAVKSTIHGMEVIGVWDIKEGKLEEFLANQQEFLTKYHKIEGYRYQMDVRFKVTEALGMIGIKMPE